MAATLSLISGNERTVRYYIQYSNPVFIGAVQPSWHRRLPGEWQWFLHCYRRVPWVHNSLEIQTCHIFSTLPEIKWKSRICCQNSQAFYEENTERQQRSMVGSPRVSQIPYWRTWQKPCPTTDVLKNKNLAANSQLLSASKSGIRRWRKDHAKETEGNILSRPHSQGTSRNKNRTKSTKCVQKLRDRSCLVQTPKHTKRRNSQSLKPAPPSGRSRDTR